MNHTSCFTYTSNFFTSQPCRSAWVAFGTALHPLLEAIGDAPTRESRSYAKANPLAKIPMKGTREFFLYLNRCAPDKIREIDGKFYVDEAFVDNLLCTHSPSGGYVFERISK